MNINLKSSIYKFKSRISNLKKNNKFSYFLILCLGLFLEVILIFIISIYIRINYLVKILLYTIVVLICFCCFKKKNKTLFNICYLIILIFLIPFMLTRSDVKFPLDIKSFNSYILYVYCLSIAICSSELLKKPVRIIKMADNSIKEAKKIYKEYMPIFYYISVIAPLILFSYTSIMYISSMIKIDIVNYLLNHFNEVISLVLFSATLSLLLFSYCMVLNDKKNKEDEIIFGEMRKNGVYLLKSTIYLIITIVLLYVVSFFQMFNISIIPNLFSINFIYAVINVFFIILVGISGIISLYFFIKGLYSSLKILFNKKN